MSEKLENGNVQMNHVNVYRELMKKIGVNLPETDSVDLIHPRYQLNEKCVWETAVGQLLISPFPHDFFPEILGFNLHFEGLTMDTMKASIKLEEGLNPYYFVFHVLIVNADSGHTAIAMQAVIKYIDQVREVQGSSAANQAWIRVQAGFIPSKRLSQAPQCPSRRNLAIDSFPRNRREAEAIRVFKAEAPVAYRIH